MSFAETVVKAIFVRKDVLSWKGKKLHRVVWMFSDENSDIKYSVNTERMHKASRVKDCVPKLGYKTDQPGIGIPTAWECRDAERP